MTKYYYRVMAHWWGDHASPTRIGENLLGWMDSLSGVDPSMADWRLLETDESGDVETSHAIDPPRDPAGIAKWVEGRVVRDDWGAPAPKDGYRLMAWTTRRDDSETTPDSLFFTATAGSPRHNEAQFQLGGYLSDPDESLVTYPAFRKALEALVACWPCPCASAYAVDPHDPRPVPVILSQADFDRAMAEPFDPAPVIFHRWMVYLSAPLAKGFSPPADLICEDTPGGGVILSATRERLDPDNPDHLAKSVRLGRIMDAIVPEYVIGNPASVVPARVGPY